MAPKNLVISIGLICSLIYKTLGVCEIIPYSPRNRNEIGRYIIEIPGNPKTYTPNQRYNVSLKINPHASPQKAFQNFELSLEGENAKNEHHPVGNFEFEFNDQPIMTKFSGHCPNTIVDANKLPKTEIKVYWVAPPQNSGCILIKGTVVESRENWFSEDGPLTKRLCEDSSENENVQTPPLRQCCACEEAKYEVAFEGRWTRNTHPHNFPSDLWSTRFSDVIGASHQFGHAFWKYDDVASIGLKDLASKGTTKTLESELKSMSENIRTIIKARGLQYPNISKSTYAVFRVDKKNHLVSLVSKITPSPDWIVGVSNLELCTADCTWEESRTLNLYPWDIGVDDGVGYTSKSPVAPYDIRLIRRLTPNNPNNPNSPFFNEDGEEIKPIAKLYLTRQRLYEKKPCEGASDDTGSEGCETTDWSDWSPCTATCRRFRTRQYMDASIAKNCEIELTQEDRCFDFKSCRIGLPPDEGATLMTEQEATTSGEVPSTISPDDTRCEVKDFKAWSNCTVWCGKGTRTRDRVLKDPSNQEICGIELLQENEECTGPRSCDDPVDYSSCQYGPWTSCSATCGNGFKKRIISVNPEGNEEAEAEEDESKCPTKEIVSCYESCEESTTNPFGDFTSNSQILEEAEGPALNCKVSSWMNTPCLLKEGEICGKGMMRKYRKILRQSQNGGKPCPKILDKYKICNVQCSETGIDLNKCTLSRWSGWSPCSAQCGPSAVRIRTRRILYQPPGVVCPERMQQKRCPLPVACNDKGEIQGSLYSN